MSFRTVLTVVIIFKLCLLAVVPTQAKRVLETVREFRTDFLPDTA